jgi:hypothetical protein
MAPPVSVYDLLDNGEHVKGRAGKLVDPRHRRHVAGVWAFSSFNSLRHSGRAPLTFSRKSWRPFGAHGQSKTLRKNSKSMFWKIGTARRDLALLLK